jgi:hypothetical protein
VTNDDRGEHEQEHEREDCGHRRRSCVNHSSANFAAARDISRTSCAISEVALQGLRAWSTCGVPSQGSCGELSRTLTAGIRRTRILDETCDHTHRMRRPRGICDKDPPAQPCEVTAKHDESDAIART